jgi:hypothetical protein
LDAHLSSGGKRVILVGHSKGANDAVAALSLYPDELIQGQRTDTNSSISSSNNINSSKITAGGGSGVVAGLVCVQAPFGGSPIATDLLEDQDLRKSVEFLLGRVLRSRSEALHDLTYQRRKEFIRKHPPLPRAFPIVCFHSTTSARTNFKGGGLTHGSGEGGGESESEVGKCGDGGGGGGDDAGGADENSADKEEEGSGWVRRNGGGRRSSSIRSLDVPLPTTLFFPAAYYMKKRYGAASDGLVCALDAEVPGCLAVRYEAHEMDHLALVYPSPTGSLRRVLKRRAAIAAAAAAVANAAAAAAVTPPPTTTTLEGVVNSCGEPTKATPQGQLFSGDGDYNGDNDHDDDDEATIQGKKTRRQSSPPPSGGDLAEALVRLLVRHFGLSATNTTGEHQQ